MARIKTRLFKPFILVLLTAVGGALFGTRYQMPSLIGRAEATACLPEPFSLEPLSIAPRDSRPLRVVTFNLHSGLGPDWRPFASTAAVKRNLRTIARQIAQAAPPTAPVDAVGLNEVDLGSRRSGGFDQARFVADELARLTGYSYRVLTGETWRRGIPGLEVRFGNALLVRHPVIASTVCRLGERCPGIPNPTGTGRGWVERVLDEPRGIIRARILHHDRPVDLLVTHLEAVVLARREAQAAEILRRFVDPDLPTVLLGDSNAVPAAMTGGRRHFAADRTHDVLSSGRLVDARAVRAEAVGAADLSAWATYPASAPEWPLDVVFASPELLPTDVRVVGASASDHRGLAARLEWLESAERERYGAWHDARRRWRLARLFACDLAGAAGRFRLPPALAVLGIVP